MRFIPHTQERGDICYCMKKKDWTNQKYCRLTFIQPTEERTKSNRILWELRCDCGTIISADAYAVRSGHTSSCGCLRIENASYNASLGNHRKYDPIISSARRVWTVNRYSEECDFETFFTLSQKNCFYCNRPPTRIYNAAMTTPSNFTGERQLQHGNFTYNGLDRIDSAKGHEPSNVVPCCFDCNKAKSALSSDEFLRLIELIYNHRVALTKTHSPIPDPKT